MRTRRAHPSTLKAPSSGAGKLIGTGAVVLVISCLTATLSTDVAPLAFALFLLGLGWNFCYVGGSTLLSDCLSQGERARIQSVNSAGTMATQNMARHARSGVSLNSG